MSGAFFSPKLICDWKKREFNIRNRRLWNLPLRGTKRAVKNGFGRTSRILSTLNRRNTGFSPCGAVDVRFSRDPARAPAQAAVWKRMAGKKYLLKKSNGVAGIHGRLDLPETTSAMKIGESAGVLYFLAAARSMLHFPGRQADRPQRWASSGVKFSRSLAMTFITSFASA